MYIFRTNRNRVLVVILYCLFSLRRWSSWIFRLLLVQFQLLPLLVWVGMWYRNFHVYICVQLLNRLSLIRITVDLYHPRLSGIPWYLDALFHLTKMQLDVCGRNQMVFRNRVVQCPCYQISPWVVHILLLGSGVVKFPYWIFTYRVSYFVYNWGGYP